MEKKVPEANGVENRELPGVAEPKTGAVLPRREGVEVDPNKDPDEELKRDVWGVAEDVPNREDVGAEVAGVENSEGVELDGAEGVLKSEKPLPDEAVGATVDVRGTADVPWVPELATNPAT